MKTKIFLLLGALMLISFVGLTLEDYPEQSQLFFYLVGICLVYFVPALVAYRRDHHQKMAIAALNILLGWTVLGWIAALIWSVTQVRKRNAPDKG